MTSIEHVVSQQADKLMAAHAQAELIEWRRRAEQVAAQVAGPVAMEQQAGMVEAAPQTLGR